MFEIKVLSYEDAKVSKESGWPTHILSLIKEDMSSWGDKHLRVQFDDVHNPTPNFVHPELFHFNRILDFTKGLTDADKLLVHCIAGISRSTSAAIAVLIQHGMAYEDAYETIRLQRPHLAPNRMIVEYTDDHFNLGGEYYCFVEKRIPFKHLTGWGKGLKVKLIGDKD